MDFQIIKIVLGLFTIFFGFHTVLFGWVFYRLNTNHKKTEDVRIESDRKNEMLRLELTKQVGEMRLEYVDKVSKLHDEDRRIRKDVNDVQLNNYQAISDLGDKLATKIENLDVMSKPDVLRLVDPIIESNKTVADAVNVLIERSNK